MHVAIVAGRPQAKLDDCGEVTRMDIKVNGRWLLVAGSLCIWHCFEYDMGLSQHKSPKSFTSL